MGERQSPFFFFWYPNSKEQQKTISDVLFERKDISVEAEKKWSEEKTELSKKVDVLTRDLSHKAKYRKSSTNGSDDGKGKGKEDKEKEKERERKEREKKEREEKRRLEKEKKKEEEAKKKEAKKKEKDRKLILSGSV